MGIGWKIAAGMRETIAYARGDNRRARVSSVSIPQNIDVQKIRKKLEMSQEVFAFQFGFPITTLRNWEQGARQPTGSARVLLTLIERIPEEIKAALAA